MDEKNNIGICFDGTFDGFLCTIYSFFYDKIIPFDIVCQNKYQPRLGVDYQEMKTNPEHALKVSVGIKKKISTDCFNMLYPAFCNDSDIKYMHLFNYIIAGFRFGAQIDKHLHWDFVLKTHKYASTTLGEAHYFKEFIRFQITKNNILYSRIEPENHVLPFLSNHFTSRLISERWVIHDVNRHLALVYDTVNFAIYEAPANAYVEDADDEELFQDLWIAFFNEIAVKERISKKRQRNMLPLKYRKNMIEFKK